MSFYPKMLPCASIEMIQLNHSMNKTKFTLLPSHPSCNSQYHRRPSASLVFISKVQWPMWMQKDMQTRSRWNEFVMGNPRPQKFYFNFLSIFTSTVSDRHMIFTEGNFHFYISKGLGSFAPLLLALSWVYSKSSQRKVEYLHCWHTCTLAGSHTFLRII